MEPFKINDPVLGDYEINEPLLLDLLHTKTIQRLKNIHQGGATYLVRKGRNGNRYEHSVGVMLLIRRLGGSVEEQAAGLLHDISHTAFSHVIDQVFSNLKETFHEEHQMWFLNSSDVPEILEKHKLDLNYIFNEDNWSILEQSQPDLCADRVDYTLRDLYNLGEITKKEINDFLVSLIIRKGKMVMDNIEQAIWFTEQYHKEVTELFMNPIEIYANNHLASTIREAMDHKILSIDDMLLKDDYQIIEQIEKSENEKLKKSIHELHLDIKVTNDKKNYDYQGFTKPRIVDPLVLDSNNLLVRCSSIAPKVTDLHAKVQAMAQEGIFVRKILN